MSCPACEGSIDALVPFEDRVVHQSGTTSRVYLCRQCNAKWQCITWAAVEHDKFELDNTTNNIQWKLLKN